MNSTERKARRQKDKIVPLKIKDHFGQRCLTSVINLTNIKRFRRTNNSRLPFSKSSVE